MIQMNDRADFFQKKMSSNRSFTRKKNSSHTWLRIIIIILLLLLWLAGWKIFWAPANLWWEWEQSMDFSLWAQVYLQWELKADGDIITHTHTIDDTNYWIIRIKSDLINLYDYAGFVELTWTVEKFYQGNPIIKVVALSGTLAWSGNNTNIALDGNAGVYILWAWIQFLPSFFDEYVLLNEWENWEIHIQNIESWKDIVLNYFRCNPSDPNKNCKGLNETFSNNNAQSFVTSEGDVYYKMSEAQSRFVSNWNRWGIFINDVSDDDVFKLKDLIKFANEKNINEWIKSRGISICQWSWEKLQRITNSEINLKQEWLIVTVSGDGMEKQMTCQILVDFSLPEKWKLQSLSIWDAVVISEESQDKEETKTETTWNVVEAPISATSLDTNVPQLPIKKECLETPDKEGCLKYESTRWGYVLNFPSSNISFSVSSVKENFGRTDINCSYVINVIKYTDKENLETTPAVRIYECDWSVSESWAQWIVVYPRLDKKFIVQMNDGSWNDFSMNLKFEQLNEE